MNIAMQITEVVWPDYVFDDPELVYHREGIWYARQFASLDDLGPMIEEAADLDFEDVR